MKQVKEDNIDRKEIANWYNKRYASGQEQSFGRPIEESVQRLEKLKRKHGGRLLDVACGQGFFLKAAHDAGYESYGIDIAAEAVAIARRISPQSQVKIASGDDLPYPNDYFDVLTCWGSLEHHPDMRQALLEFARVTKPGATIFLRVPNKHFWVYRMGQLLGMRTGTEQQELIEHLLTLSDWLPLFEAAGLSVVEVSPDNWFLQQPFDIRHGLLQSGKLALRKAALAVAPLSQTYSFDFRCRI